ncbi:MAG: aminomethyltransferase beta-barrel domain-containing protein, partial [Chitinophagaceae bacterium]
ALGKPAFVTEIIPETNTVVLGNENDLNRHDMTVGKINMIKYEHITPEMDATVKIRYKDKGSPATLHPENGIVKVRFFEDAKGVAPGQSAVFYEDDDVIGGGTIQRYAQPNLQ